MTCNVFSGMLNAAQSVSLFQGAELPVPRSLW